MSATRSIGWRFLLRGTERGTFSAMTVFAWLAIGVGVWAMGSLLSVMYGFEGSLRDKVLKAYPHVMVRPPAGAPMTDYREWTTKFRALPAAKRVMPYLDTEMIIQSEHRTLGGVVWGIPVPDLESYRDGLEGSLPNPKGREPELIVGSELAHRLGASVGDRLKIISPIDKSGALGMMPQALTFRISGTYSSGHYEFDQQYLFMPLEDAQDLLRRGDSIAGWHLWAATIDGADDLERQVRAILPAGWEAQSWKVFNAALFSSLKLEQFAMFLVLSFAVAIAVMNVVITLMMHVAHKRKNIGVLRALGASTRSVRRIFLWQGTMLGGVGLLFGAFLTVLFIIYIRYFSTVLLPDIYYDRTIPVEIRPWSFVIIYGTAIVMIFLATLYPAARAAKMDPIEAIRE